MSVLSILSILSVLPALSVFCFRVTNSQEPVIVLVHGVASNAEKLSYFKDQLVASLSSLSSLSGSRNITVFVPNIGNGDDDSMKSMNLQLQMLYDEILHKEVIAIVGFSQGGLLARGLVETYGKMFNIQFLITVGTPNGGQYSIDTFNVNYIYNYMTQMTFSVSNYWRDPYNYQTYIENSLYLSVINNDKEENTENAENLKALKMFAMVWSPIDEVIEPPESAMFSTYVPTNIGNQLKLIPYNKSSYWTNLGLNETNIVIYETNCGHLEYVSEGCAKIVIDIITNLI